MGLAAGYKFTEAFNRDQRKRLKRPSVREFVEVQHVYTQRQQKAKA